MFQVYNTKLLWAMQPVLDLLGPLFQVVRKMSETLATRNRPRFSEV